MVLIFSALSSVREVDGAGGGDNEECGGVLDAHGRHPLGHCGVAASH